MFKIVALTIGITAVIFLLILAVFLINSSWRTLEEAEKRQKERQSATKGDLTYFIKNKQAFQLVDKETGEVIAIFDADGVEIVEK